MRIHITADIARRVFKPYVGRLFLQLCILIYALSIFYSEKTIKPLYSSALFLIHLYTKEYRYL